jgi:hypothetical protein
MAWVLYGSTTLGLLRRGQVESNAAAADGAGQREAGASCSIMRWEEDHLKLKTTLKPYDYDLTAGIRRLIERQRQKQKQKQRPVGQDYPLLPQDAARVHEDLKKM